MRSVLGVAILATLASAEPNVMNKGGIPYQISNPPGATKDWKGTPGNYSVDFMHNVTYSCLRGPGVNKDIVPLK